MLRTLRSYLSLMMRTEPEMRILQIVEGKEGGLQEKGGGYEKSTSG